MKFILNQTELTILVVHPKTVAAYLKYLPEVRITLQRQFLLQFYWWSNAKLSISLCIYSPPIPLPQVPYLKTLVKLGSVSDEEKAQAKEYDVEILSWADFEVLPDDHPYIFIFRKCSFLRLGIYNNFSFSEIMKNVILRLPPLTSSGGS